MNINLVCKGIAAKRCGLSNTTAQQSVHPTSGSLRGLEAFLRSLRVFSTSQRLSTPAPPPLTQTVRPHVILLSVKTSLFLNYGSLSLLAIRFLLQSFFLRCHSFSLAFFSLLVFSSLITWSACWHFLHIGSRECQVDFVGNVFFGCGVLPAIVS